MLRPFPSSMRAAAITPADPVGACVARFPTGASLPRFCGGSASALHVSRPARRSLVLRPAWSLNRPWRQGNRISSCPCQYLQQVPCIETAKESFLPDAEGSGAFLS